MCCLPHYYNSLTICIHEGHSVIILVVQAFSSLLASIELLKYSFITAFCLFLSRQTHLTSTIGAPTKRPGTPHLYSTAILPAHYHRKRPPIIDLRFKRIATELPETSFPRHTATFLPFSLINFTASPYLFYQSSAQLRPPISPPQRTSILRHFTTTATASSPHPVAQVYTTDPITPPRSVPPERNSYNATASPLAWLYTTSKASYTPCIPSAVPTST